MRYAIVDNATKVVVNISKWDGVTPWAPPAGTKAVNVENVQCNIGWVEQPDGTFAPPEEASAD
jgi:hypothetical protein